jgi:hypothetical protein
MIVLGANQRLRYSRTLEVEADGGIDEDVAEPRSMLEEVVDRDLVRARPPIEQMKLVESEKAECVEVLGGPIIQAQVPLLHRLEDDRRDERLGDAGDVELEGLVDRHPVPSDALVHDQLPSGVLGTEEDVVHRLHPTVFEMRPQDPLDRRVGDGFVSRKSVHAGLVQRGTFPLNVAVTE